VFSSINSQMNGKNHLEQIDAPWVVEVICETFDDALNFLIEDTFVYGGAVRDAIAGLPLVGDIDISADPDGFEEIMHSLIKSVTWERVAGIQLLKNKSSKDNGLVVPMCGTSQFRNVRDKRMDLVSSKYKSKTSADVSLYPARTVDFRCCGVALSVDGTVYETVEGALSDCKDKVLVLNKNVLDVNEQVLTERIKKLSERGWTSRIDIKKAVKTSSVNAKREAKVQSMKNKRKGFLLYDIKKTAKHSSKESKPHKIIMSGSLYDYGLIHATVHVPSNRFEDGSFKSFLYDVESMLAEEIIKAYDFDNFRKNVRASRRPSDKPNYVTLSISVNTSSNGMLGKTIINVRRLMDKKLHSIIKSCIPKVVYTGKPDSAAATPAISERDGFINKQRPGGYEYWIEFKTSLHFKEYRRIIPTIPDRMIRVLRRRFVEQGYNITTSSFGNTPSHPFSLQCAVNSPEEDRGPQHRRYSVDLTFKVHTSPLDGLYSSKKSMSSGEHTRCSRAVFSWALREVWKEISESEWGSSRITHK